VRSYQCADSHIGFQHTFRGIVFKPALKRHYADCIHPGGSHTFLLELSLNGWGQGVETVAHQNLHSAEVHSGQWSLPLLLFLICTRIRGNPRASSTLKEKNIKIIKK